MKIMHLIGFFQPKLGYEEYYLAKTQLKRGHEVIVVTSDRYYPFSNFNSIYLEVLGDRFSPKVGYSCESGVPTIRLNPYFEFDTSVLLKGLGHRIREFCPDVIHIHGMFHPLTLQGIFLAQRKFTNVKIILDEHMIFKFSLNLKFPIKKLYYDYIYRIIFKILRNKINGLYATKESVSKYLTSRYGINVPVIPIGVDTKIFDSSKYPSKDVRKELNLENQFIMFYSGKIVQGKGLEELVSIFRRLSKKYDIGLLFVGNGPKNFVIKITEFIKSNNLSNSFRSVSFLDHRELPRYMSAANLGCWIGDTPSASINEMISIGRPILVKIFEGYDLGRLGYTFAKRHISQEDSIRWISGLIENNEDYEKSCIKARKYALGNLDWNKTTERVLKLYES